MKKFATKVMGIALAVPMVLGGAMVSADEIGAQQDAPAPGDEVFQAEYYVSGTRYGGQKYYYGLDTFVAPVSGDYYFVTSNEDDSYLYAVRSVEPEFSIDGNLSTNPGDFWNCYAAMHLNEGAHIISWQGFYPGSFTLTGTLVNIDPEENADVAVEEDADVAVKEDADVAVEDVVIIEENTVDMPVLTFADEIVVDSADYSADYSSVPVDERLASVRNFVGHLYLEGLGRECSAEDLESWVDKIVGQNISASEVATQILTSSEFDGKNLSDEEFAAVINDVFGMKEDKTSEIVEALSSGTSRSSVIGMYTKTEDWASKCAFYLVNV